MCCDLLLMTVGPQELLADLLGLTVKLIRAEVVNWSGV